MKVALTIPDSTAPHQDVGQASRPVRTGQEACPTFRLSRDRQGAVPKLLMVLCLMIASAGISAEVIDRIVATVGNQVITESEIRKQTRLAQFLNQAPPDIGRVERRKTLDRLIEQALLRLEMTASRYPLPGPVEAENALAALKTKSFRTEAEYTKALARYVIREDDLKDHLQWQIGLLQFCEFRFGTDLQVSSADVEEYYRQKFRDGQAPKLEEVRETIEKILIAERTNQSLDRWLKETRAKTRIEIRQESFE